MDPVTAKRVVVKSIDCPSCMGVVPIPRTETTKNMAVSFLRCPHCDHGITTGEILEQVTAMLGDEK